jgi:hypothetical protein
MLAFFLACVWTIWESSDTWGVWLYGVCPSIARLARDIAGCLRRAVANVSILPLQTMLVAYLTRSRLSLGIMVLPMMALDISCPYDLLDRCL